MIPKDLAKSYTQTTLKSYIKTIYKILYKVKLFYFEEVLLLFLNCLHVFCACLGVVSTLFY
jgi:hypothetical protein